MAFGQEMKDFIAAFQVGYSMFKSKDEKEWEKEERQMKREAHQWGHEDRDFRGKKFERGIFESDRDSDYRERRFDYEVDESGRSHGRWETDHHRLTRDQQIREEQLKLERAKEQGVTPQYDGGGYTSPWEKRGGGGGDAAIGDGASFQPTSFKQTGGGVGNADYAMYMGQQRASAGGGGGGGAIPDGVDPARTGSVQQASYAPREGATAQVNRGGSFIEYTNQNATRNKPLSRELTAALEKVLPDLGVTARVYSGGQDAKGKGSRRTGSTRHDHGNAADVNFFKDGRKLDWSNPKDRPIFEEIVRRGKAAGLTGFGAGPGYMGRGSMHIGFGAPGVWGKGGKSDNAPRWLVDAYYGGNRQVAGYARGGLVAAIPDDEEDVDETYLPTIDVEAEAPPQQTVEVVGEETSDPVLPESGRAPIPSPRYEGGMEGPKEEPTTDRWEAARRSVRDGAQRAAENSGFDINSAIDDPELERMRQNYLRGYGAAPAGMMRQVLDKIDPEGKMPPAERNMAAMAEVYQFYIARGDEEQAKEAAASMYQYYKRSFQQFSALARAAVQEGDLDNAQKAAIAAYANIPNGRDLAINKLDDGTYEVTVTDMRTSEVVTERIMNPQDFGALAMNFNPATFETEILAAAGAPRKEADRVSTSDLESAAETVRSFAEDYFTEDSGFNEREQNALRDIAVDLASNKTNGMDAERALRTAISFLDIDQATDDEGRLSNLEPNFSEKKIPNSNLWEIHFRGDVFEVSTGTRNAIKTIRDAAVEKATEENERGITSDKNWQENIDYLKKGVDAFGDLLRGGAGVEGGEYVTPQEGIPMVNPDPVRSPFAQDEPDDPSYVPQPDERQRNPYYPPGR